MQDPEPILADQLTPEQQAERDALEAAETRNATIRGAVLQTAQSTVGVRLADLTQAQIKSLIAVLLYRAGGVDPATLAVRPLGEWVR
jgi:hypothetical protein